jgi:hypothetical protein
MILPGFASIPFLTDPSFGAGIVTALGAVAAVHLARLLLPRRESISATPPVPDAPPRPFPVPPPPPTTSESCADHWETLDAPEGERRKHRRRAGKPVQVQLLGPGDRHPRPAYVVDRSQGGFRLLVEKPFPVNAILRARPGDAPDNVVWVRAKVRWCSTEEGRHEVGCHFTDHPPLHVLLLFG